MSRMHIVSGLFAEVAGFAFSWCTESGGDGIRPAVLLGLASLVPAAYFLGDAIFSRVTQGAGQNEIVS